MNRNTIGNCIRLLTVALMLKCGSVATAVLPSPGDIIFAHVGTNNPTSEGFTLALGTGITTPAPNPAGTAWRFADDNPDPNQRAFYSWGGSPLNGSLTASQITKLQTRGWMAEWTVDVLTSHDLSHRDVYLTWGLNNGNGDRRYNIHLHETGSGLQLDANPNFTAADATIAGTNFHSIAVVNYGNNTDAVELFVDGNSILTFSPTINDSSTFSWGGSIADTGAADWSLVRFSVVPEPASAILCLGGSLLLLRRRK